MNWSPNRLCVIRKAFKNSALSEEEQEALSQHLALLTARQSELSMLIEHLQKENGKLAADSQSVLSSEELHVLRDHIEALTAQNAELSLQAQQYTNEHAELAARHNDYVADTEHNGTPLSASAASCVVLQAN